MDESTLTVYRCPGEDYDIDRAIHLGRLAAYYPACRECAHRHDSDVLSAQQVKRIAQAQRRSQSETLVHAEGLSGVVHNELTPRDVRHVAAAMGLCLREGRRPDEPQPLVVVAGDGRALTCELLAAASEGLRLAGCRVVELGAATAGLLAWSAEHLQALGGLLVGNARGEPHTASIKLWGHGACPWSAGGSLEPVISLCKHGIARPTRRYGSLERQNCAEGYLARMRDFYHALRPLRLVLDTASSPLVRQLEELLSHSACELVRPSRLETRNSKLETASRGDFVERRITHLSEQVQAGGAHFGVWVDGDGDICRVVDERGRGVSSQRLLVALARQLAVDRPGAVVLLEQEAASETERAIAAAGAQVVRSPATRQAMHAALDASGAIVGGGPSGRFWFQDTIPRSDALLTLSLLLTLLSQTDRPLSAVLDATGPSE